MMYNSFSTINEMNVKLKSRNRSGPEGPSSKDLELVAVH